MYLRRWGCLLLLSVVCILPAHAYKIGTHAWLPKAQLDQLHADAMKLFAQGEDGWRSRYAAAEFWRKHQTALQSGQVACDLGPLLYFPPSFSPSHGYNPDTNKGWLGAMNAIDLAAEYERQGKNQYEIGFTTDAAFVLGAASHLLSDMGVPHHIECKLFDGHGDFEATVEKLHDRITTRDRFGIYLLPGKSLHDMPKQDIAEWGKYIARQVWPDYKLVGPNTREARRYDEEVGLRSLDLVVRAGAGYLYWLYIRLHQ